MRSRSVFKLCTAWTRSNGGKCTKKNIDILLLNAYDIRRDFMYFGKEADIENAELLYFTNLQLNKFI